MFFTLHENKIKRDLSRVAASFSVNSVKTTGVCNEPSIINYEIMFFIKQLFVCCSQKQFSFSEINYFLPIPSEF